VVQQALGQVAGLQTVAVAHHQELFEVADGLQGGVEVEALVGVPVGAVGEVAGGQRQVFALFVAEAGGFGLRGDLAVQEVQYPFAEVFGDGGAGQHGQQVGSAQAEDADGLFAAAGVEIHQSCHLVGELLGVAIKELRNRLTSLGIPQGCANLVPP